MFLFMFCHCNPGKNETVGIQGEDHLVPAKNNLKLHIRELRPAFTKFEEPLVMIHGGGPGATSSFDLPVPGGSFAGDLAEKGFNVYLVNIRGWEKSTLPAYDFTDSSQVIGSHLEAGEDLKQAISWILKKENVSQVNLFGWATGGHWASSYTIKHPETVSRLISLNSLYGVEGPWSLRRFFSNPGDSSLFNKTAFFRTSPRENLSRTWTRTIPIENKKDWRDPGVEEAYRQVAASFGDDSTVMKVPGGYREESFYMSLGVKYWDAKDITVPALIIRTELDFWSRLEDLQAIQRDLVNSPGSKFLTLPGTHYVFLDRPGRGRQRLIDEIIKFINS